MTEIVPQEGSPVLLGRKNNVSRRVFFATILVTMLVGFVLGTRAQELYAVGAPLLGIKASAETLDLAMVQKVYRELKANYDGRLDSTALTDGAARGMVAAVGDRYTVFMDKHEASDFAKELSGEVTGVGCELGMRSDQPTILRVLADSPAQKAGLQPGDVFVSVNEVSVVGADSSTVATKIRGPEGTTVDITIARGSETKRVTMTRARLSDPSVRWHVTNGIGLLTISRFDTDTVRLTRRAADEFTTQRVSGVVLDVRDNGGGYLDAAQGVASLWLVREQIVVTEKMGDDIIDTIKTSGEATLQGVPTVVLVNGGSASASEIVAGALQDYGAAQLLGEKTFGKGTVQKLITLPGGRQLKVTTARWYTPKGKNISKEGIAPDTTIQLTSQDANAGRDPQLEAAYAIITK